MNVWELAINPKEKFMLTKKYGKLFRCDYRGNTTTSSTRRGARIMMEIAVFWLTISYEELMAR